MGGAARKELLVSPLRRPELPRREARRLPAAVRDGRASAPRVPRGAARGRDYEDLPGEVAGGDPPGGAEPAGPARRVTSSCSRARTGSGWLAQPSETDGRARVRSPLIPRVSRLDSFIDAAYATGAVADAVGGQIPVLPTSVERAAGEALKDSGGSRGSVADN